jgi:hypothetical protein
MPVPPLEEMRIVASRPKPLNVPFAFVGGAVMCLLVDHPELTDFRSTKDVPSISCSWLFGSGSHEILSRTAL